VVPLFEFGDFVPADGQYHLERLLCISRSPSTHLQEVAGQQFGALPDVFGLLRV